MADAVSNISNETFQSHVDETKNDIADWVLNVYEKKELADKLRQAGNKEEAAQAISKHDETDEFDEAGKDKDDKIQEDSKDEDKKDSTEDKKVAENIEKKEEPESEEPKQEEKEENKEKPSEQVEKESDDEIDEISEEYKLEESNDTASSRLSYEKIKAALPSPPIASKIRGILKKVKEHQKAKRKIRKKILKKEAKKEYKKQAKKSKKVEYVNDEKIYKPEYVKLDVPGFDEMITNGVPKGSSMLLCGGAGTGKTTFSLQVLAQGAQKGEKCLYLTFEEDTARLRAHMVGFGWDPIKLQKQGNFMIKKMDSFEVSRSVEALLAKASGELIIDVDEVEGIIPEGFMPDRIVLDSLSAVSAAFAGKEEGYRIYVEQLFNLFKKIGATSFLISEVEEESNKYTRSGIEEFLADAVVVFYNLRQKSVRVNALEIIKIRGTKHEKKIVPFKIIAGSGITVFPKEDPFLE